MVILVTNSRERISHPISPEETDRIIAGALADRLPWADIEAMELTFSLIRAADRIQQDFEVNVQRPAGMTWAAFRTMFALATLGSLRPLELARLNSVSQPSISSGLKTLTAKGYVSSEPSPEDARSITVSLTEAGRQRFEELFRANNARESQWAEMLDAAERRVLMSLLMKVRDFPAPPLPAAAGSGAREDGTDVTPAAGTRKRPAKARVPRGPSPA